MKVQLMAAVAASSLVAGCTTVNGETSMNDSTEMARESAPRTAANPTGTGYFAQQSTLPFHAPDFTRIKDDDYLPAFRQGMAIQDAEVATIVTNPAAPTFDNTIVALETSGRMLTRVSRVFFALTGSNTNDTLKAINTEISPELSAHDDAIQLNPQLFARVKAVYDQRAEANMTPEDAKLLERTYTDMVHAGALLTPAQKEQVKAINTELSSVTTQFSQRLVQASKDNALIVSDKSALVGLSDGEIEAAAKTAAGRGMDGKYVLALQNTTQQPMLTDMASRAACEKLYLASIHRADQGNADDTRDLVAKIVSLRAQKAALFGQPDWASYVMYDRMAKTPRTAIDFMEQMVPALAATQKREAAMLNQQIKDDGEGFTVQPWDWSRYAEQVRKAKYDLDESETKPYFQITRVLEDGVFYAANRLYGLTFKKRTDLPVYQKDVTTYTVYDKDGSELGLFYFDPYQRDNKRGGAWMSNFVSQSHLFGDKPVIYNVLNIPKVPAGEPQLVSFDNVETMFHEFGHALHGFFANQKYASLSGTATARDFVEFPSQVNEMWASDPEVLAHYAQHYQTGKPIPAALIAKIKAAAKFDQGYALGEVVEASLLDMKWHSLSAAQAAAIDTPDKVNAFESKSLKDLGLQVDLVPPRYRSSYFSHIFSNPAGYSAGYYSYLWTEMLDRDAQKWFRNHGGLTRANGDHFRDTVLSRGGTMDYFKMFENFAGRDPDVQPMLEARGLVEEKK